MGLFDDMCPYCMGTGKLKAKRAARQLNGPPVVYDEVLMVCNFCNGTGTTHRSVSAPRGRRTEK